MGAWAWILIVGGAVLLIVLLWLAITKGRESARDRKRREAERLRLEAEKRLAGAEQSERSAKQAAQTVADERATAERMRTEAQAREARAEELEEIAEREGQRAREQRTVAERTARQAQSVDPLAPDPGDQLDVDQALARRSEDASRSGTPAEPAVEDAASLESASSVEDDRQAPKSAEDDERAEL
jgi:hypothetical protein